MGYNVTRPAIAVDVGSSPTSVTFVFQKVSSPPLPVINSTGSATGRFAIPYNETVSGQINESLSNGMIPVVVNVSSSRATASILEENFSVSVVSTSGNNFTLLVSAVNVSGPRTILINTALGGPNATSALVVLLDGRAIPEAPSLASVLTGNSSAAEYAVVLTSQGVQLLVRVPHFSTHVIQVAQVSPQAEPFPQSFVPYVAAVAVAASVLLFLALRRRKINIRPFA